MNRNIMSTKTNKEESALEFAKKLGLVSQTVRWL